MADKSVGRNEPCPCGSGRKFKVCCLGRGEVGPGGGGSVTEELAQSLEGRDFGSLEALQAEVDRFMAQRNTASVDAFHGVSPEQMHRLLYFPFDSPTLVSFPDPLAVEPEAPVLMLFGGLVEGLGENGVKATAKGNLPRALCKGLAQGVLESEYFNRYWRRLVVNREDDFHELHVVRLVAELAGLVRKYKGRFVLTRKCRDTLQRSGMAGIYPILFRAFVEKFNWGYSDGYQALPFIQQSFLFSLYLLSRYGGEVRPGSFYVEAYLQAFPMVLAEVEPTPYSPPEETLRRCYMLRTFERFAAFFGLATVERGDKKDFLASNLIIGKTPLLGEVVKFASVPTRQG